MCTLLTEVLDSILDYPVYYALTQGFNSTDGSLSVLSATVQASQDAYAYGEFRTGSFLENQDNPRFPSLTSDEAVRTSLSGSVLWGVLKVDCDPAYQECDGLAVHP